MPTFKANVNLDYNELTHFEIENVGSLPSQHAAQLVYLTSDNKFYGSDGTNWIAMNLSGAEMVTAINASAGTIDDDNLSSNVSSAISLKHSQNTDTGTSSSSFAIGPGTDVDITITANNADANKPAIRYNHTSNVWELSNNGTDFSAISASSATVSSVGLSMPSSEFTVSNSPVTSTGTLTATWKSQTAHYVFAAPSGSAGTPTFRALVSGDIPDLSATYLTASSTATLTNKSLSDSTTYFVDNTDTSKKMQFELSGITTSTTRTITIPNATGTMALTSDIPTAYTSNPAALGTADDGSSTSWAKGDHVHPTTGLCTLTGTETLTNKSLSDSTTYFIDNSDNTKKMQFQLSGITASTTRTLTIPNSDGTIALTSDIPSVPTAYTSNPAALGSASPGASGNWSRGDHVHPTTGLVLTSGDQTVAGTKTFSSTITSNVTTGTAPLTVASTTVVTNLNADKVDGKDAADFMWTTHAANAITGFGASGSATTVARSDHTHSTLHTQNTDTGTTSSYFAIDSDGATPIRLYNTSGTLEVKDDAGTSYLSLKVLDLTVTGTQTIINSNTVEIGDNTILLNSDVAANAQNSDGGIAVKRLKADNSTRADAELNFNNTTGRWDVTYGDVASVHTAALAMKYSADIGNASATSFQVTHNFGTRDVQVTVRSNTSYEIVYPDVVATTVDYVTVSFGVEVPDTNEYRVIVVG